MRKSDHAPMMLPSLAKGRKTYFRASKLLITY